MTRRNASVDPLDALGFTPVRGRRIVPVRDDGAAARGVRRIDGTEPPVASATNTGIEGASMTTCPHSNPHAPAAVVPDVRKRKFLVRSSIVAARPRGSFAGHGPAPAQRWRIQPRAQKRRERHRPPSQVPSSPAQSASRVHPTAAQSAVFPVHWLEPSEQHASQFHMNDGARSAPASSLGTYMTKHAVLPAGQPPTGAAARSQVVVRPYFSCEHLRPFSSVNA